jgi:thymidine kinase
LKAPKLIMFIGPMFGSKTTRLIAALDRYKYQKKKILAFKPYVDDRYASNEIVTHNGGRVPARCVSNGSDIVNFVKSESCDVIAIDEAFMISGIDEAVISLYKMGITVLLSSLDLSSKGKPFEEVKNIMPWATKIIKCPSVCPKCGDDAHFTYRKFDDDRDLLIGGAEMYEPRCFNHYILNPDGASFINEN